MTSDNNLISIGGLIDTLIRVEQMEEEKPTGLTKFIEQIANKAGLSTRQIGRIRDSEDFPESNAINKLIPVLAQQMRAIRLDDIAHRLLLPWESILDDQNRLIEKSENNSITIAAGWNKPRGLEIDSIAESIAEHLQKGTSYTFLYPDPSTYPQEDTQKSPDEIKEMVKEWIETLTRKVVTIWYSELMKNKVENDDILLSEFKRKANDKIKRVHTGKGTNLWNLLPSDFCVLYNIDREKEEEFCYGYFVINGSIMLEKKSKGITRVGSYGHLYINPDDYSRIRESYKKDVESKIL
jgi:hypothetical protein